jgi:hypothetical protein
MKRIMSLFALVITLPTLAFCAETCCADQALSFNNAVLTNSTAAQTADGLTVIYEAGFAYPNVRWNAPASGWDWSGHNAFAFTLKNPGAADQSFGVRLDSMDTATGKDLITQGSGVMTAGKTQTFYISFNALSDPKSMGMNGGPPIGGVGSGTAVWATTMPNSRNVTEYQIFLDHPSTPVTFEIESIALSDRDYKPNYNGLVDQYGQYTGADWPGKILSDADFASQKKDEAADIKAHPAPKDRDKWGGWIGGPKQRATGFFYTKKIDGRWWLVDPDGRLFLSVGLDCVGVTFQTKITGREQLFSSLPVAGDPLAVYFQNWGGDAGRQFDFEAANLGRKYGADNKVSVSSIADARLLSWGFTTIGNWSSEEVNNSHRVPYVATGGVSGDFVKLHDMADPYDPAFAQAAESSIGKLADSVKNDPWCVGYYIDNELQWANWSSAGNDQAFDIPWTAFGLNADASPAKSAFIELLKNKYTTIDGLNAAWGTKFTSWDDMRAPITMPTTFSAGIRQDLSDCQYAHALRYYTIIRDTIRRHDPNHLYLGSRLAVTTKEVTKAAGQICDVVSFNIYKTSVDPSMDYIAELDCPCIIGEFHFGALDRGMFSGGLQPVKDQQDRGAHYAAYVTSVLSNPLFVGCHWFQYGDEPTTGRSDGENYNIGFVSGTDTPYPEIISAARAINAKIYQIHNAAGK